MSPDIVPLSRVRGRSAHPVAAIVAGVVINALMFWMLAIWNRPQHFETEPEPPVRLVFTTEAVSAPPSRPPPPEPPPPKPPQPMEVNLDLPPEPPQIQALELELDLSVPSVDAVFVAVATPDSRPTPTRPQAAPQPSPTISREPRDAETVDQPPRELTQMRPAYPRVAERLGREGSVRIRALVDEAGKVREVRTLEVVGHPAFEQAVLDEVYRWRLTPPRHRGQPVRVWVTKTVRFEMER